MRKSVLFLILGLGMLGSFNIQLPNNLLNKVNSTLSNQVGGNYLGVVIIGSLSALLVTACVAPPLVATLMVIGQSGDILRGVVALSSLSLGLGIPLIIIGLSASRWLPTSGEYLEVIKSLFGFVMFGLAIWVINPIISQNALITLWILLGFVTIFYYLGRLQKLGFTATESETTYGRSVGGITGKYCRIKFRGCVRSGLRPSDLIDLFEILLNI